MADLAGLARRLHRLESLAPRAALQAPPMVAVPSWEGEDSAAEEYASTLRATFPATYVERLRYQGPRPAGLLAMWETGAWLTRAPSQAEQADARPDLRRPTEPRADWRPHASSPPLDPPPGGMPNHAGAPLESQGAPIGGKND